MRIGVLGILSICSATAMSAQDSPMRVTLVAHGGVHAQTGPFRQDLGALVPGLVTRYRFDRGGSLGASLELGRARFPLGIRVSVNQSPSLGLERTPGSLGAPFLEPATGRVTTATVAVVLEPRRTCFGRVCPRALLGGGIKRYRFDANLLLDDIVEPFADDQFHPTLQMGVGVRATVGKAVLMADVTDFSNGFRFTNQTYPGRRVHDTIVSLGVGVTLKSVREDRR
jgi:hypothetical protein